VARSTAIFNATNGVYSVDDDNDDNNHNNIAT
jgi:hypothetical protein